MALGCVLEGGNVHELERAWHLPWLADRLLDTCFIVSCEKQLFHIYSVRIQYNYKSCVQQYDTTVSDGLTVGDCLKMAAITVLHDLFT